MQPYRVRPDDYVDCAASRQGLNESHRAHDSSRVRPDDYVDCVASRQGLNESHRAKKLIQGKTC